MSVEEYYGEHWIDYSYDEVNNFEDYTRYDELKNGDDEKYDGEWELLNQRLDKDAIQQYNQYWNDPFDITDEDGKWIYDCCFS